MKPWMNGTQPELPMLRQIVRHMSWQCDHFAKNLLMQASVISFTESFRNAKTSQ